MSKNIKFINVAGFFWSGSSAVVDLLKEYRHFYECDAEIRFIKDPYGISQLETSLVEHWELINSAAAIADFREMCRKGCRPGNHFYSQAGMGYANRIAKDFMKLVDEYIARLTEYTYIADYYHFKFKKSYLKYLIDRYRTGIEFYTNGKLKVGNRKLRPLCFSHPTQEQFNEATKWFFDALFHEHADEDKDMYVVLDQAVSPSNTQVIHRYFNDSKMIIVDRDPRDMFVSELRTGAVVGKDVDLKEAGRRFAMRQKAMRSSMIIDEDVLYIHFEDLVLHYDETKKQIEFFLGLNPAEHLTPQKYLDPSVSQKNAGLWKNYYDKYKEALDSIKENVPELCYNK